MLRHGASPETPPRGEDDRSDRRAYPQPSHLRPTTALRPSAYCCRMDGALAPALPCGCARAAPQTQSPGSLQAPGRVVRGNTASGCPRTRQLNSAQWPSVRPRRWTPPGTAPQRLPCMETRPRRRVPSPVKHLHTLQRMQQFHGECRKADGRGSRLRPPVFSSDHDIRGRRRGSDLPRGKPEQEPHDLSGGAPRDGEGGREDYSVWAPLLSRERGQHGAHHHDPKEDPRCEQESSHHEGVCSHCILQTRVNPFAMRDRRCLLRSPGSVTPGIRGRNADGVWRPSPSWSPGLHPESMNCNGSASRKGLRRPASLRRGACRRVRPGLLCDELLARETVREGLPGEVIETIRTEWWTTCLGILPDKARARGRF